MRRATLCLLVSNSVPPQVLLGYKKIGFGQGKYVGFGGKIEAGETIIAAAARELQEETSLVVPRHELQPVGRLTFLFPAKPDWDHLAHVFLADTWTGTPTESNEVKPAWFRIDDLPLSQMWDDAAYWLPLVLAGRRIWARFVFNEDNETVGHAEIRDWPGSLDLHRKQLFRQD